MKKIVLYDLQARMQEVIMLKKFIGEWESQKEELLVEIQLE